MEVALIDAEAGRISGVEALETAPTRLHDQDKSAWWILIGLIPFVGSLIVLIMCGFIAGTPGPNRFGDVPAI